MRRSSSSGLVGSSVLCGALLVGCSSADTSAPSTTQPPAASAPTGQLTVLAAASLTDAFNEIGNQFEAANPGTKVTFSYGPSSRLASQITQGAPADVFASASAKNMATVVTAKAAGTPSTFARNVMRIAVPPANPANITQLSDLAKANVKVALCAEAVPCGSAARNVFSNARLTVTPVTDEADVKATLTKVQLGEVDAGLVYVTDVLAAGSKVKGIDIPAAVNASTDYPIATLSASKNPALAEAFVDYVLSAAGTSILKEAGFEQP